MDDKTLQRLSRMEGVVVLLSSIQFPLARNKSLHIFASEKYKEHDHIFEETSHVLIDGRKRLVLGVRS